MGRHPRDAAAGTHHVTLHAVAEEPLFADATDYRKRLALLERETCEEFRVNMFCLMGNHEHLIVTVADNVLPLVMREANRSYARWFNRRRGRRGHVYSARYFSERIQSEAHALSCVRYVALNPEGARWTAESYPWSSYRSLVTGTNEFEFVDPEPLLGWFGGRERARQEIVRFVNAVRLAPAA